MTLIKQNDERISRSLSRQAGHALLLPARTGVHPVGDQRAAEGRRLLCTIYRGMHDMLAKGLPIKLLWAELAGRVTGTCKGKGGPMHLTLPGERLMVTTGIVGSAMPIA